MSIYSVTLNRDLARLSKCAAGAAVVQTAENPFEGFGLMAGVQGGMSALQGGSWLISNYGNYGNAWSEYKAARAAKNAEYIAAKGDDIFSTLAAKDRLVRLNEYASKYTKFVKPANYASLSDAQKLKIDRKLLQSGYYDEVRDLIAKAKSATGDRQKQLLALIEKKVAQANLNVHNAKLNGNLVPESFGGKAWAGVKKYTGMSYVGGKTKEVLAGSGKGSAILRKLTKGAGGNALFAAVSIGFQTPEIVETYKTLGKQKGRKQLGRVVATTAAETVGFALGAAAWAKAGAAIGATIGTAVPVVGNIVGGVVGGIIGLACGFAGSWLAKKGAGLIVGEKSELQKHRDLLAKDIMKEASENSMNKEALLALVDERVKSGELTDEEKLMIEKSYKNIEKELKKDKKVDTKKAKEEQVLSERKYLLIQKLDALC